MQITEIINILLFSVLALYSLAGLISGKFIKTTSDYYVMSEKAPTVFLVGAICSCYISGVTMGSGAGQAYQNGPMSMLLTAPLGAWTGIIVAVLFIGRKLRALNCYTIPDFFQKRFASREVTFLATCIMIVGLTAYGIAQLVVAGTLLSGITGISYGNLVLIFMVTLLLFCVPGGTWGVMITGVLLFIPIVVGVLIICPKILSNIGIDAMTQNLPDAFANFWSRGGLEDRPISWSITQFLVWMMFFACSPLIISRVFPARNDFSVIKSCLISVPVIAVMVTVIYLTSGAMRFTDVDIPVVDSVLLTAYLTQVPSWMGAVGIIAIVCAIISTASGLFSIAGFGLSHDMYNLTGNDDQDEKKALLRGRICQVIVILSAGLVAYTSPLGGFDLSVLASAVFAAGWLPVIILALVWRRMNSLAAFVGMLTGVGSLLVLWLLSRYEVIQWPSWMTLYLVSIALSTLVTWIMGFLFKPKPEELHCFYKILNTKLSDSMPKELRNKTDSVPTLIQGYKSTRMTIRIIVISVVVLGSAFIYVFALPQL